jgi:hypothetical protein
MGQDLDYLLKVMNTIASAFGPVFATLFLLLLTGIGLILFYFKSRISSISKEISDKAVSEFNKRLELFFRDEEVRRQLRIEIAKKSIEKKLALYDEIYSLYFSYQKSWQYNATTPDDVFDALWQRIVEMRQKVFLNVHYLGGELAQCFIDITIFMMDNMQERVARKGYNTLGYDPTLSTSKREFNIGENLERARKWIESQLFTDQKLMDYEVTEEQRELIESERSKFIDSTAKGERKGQEEEKNAEDVPA